MEEIAKRCEEKELKEKIVDLKSELSSMMGSSCDGVMEAVISSFTYAAGVILADVTYKYANGFLEERSISALIGGCIGGIMSSALHKFVLAPVSRTLEEKRQRNLEASYELNRTLGTVQLEASTRWHKSLSGLLTHSLLQCAQSWER